MAILVACHGDPRARAETAPKANASPGAPAGSVTRPGAASLACRSCSSLERCEPGGCVPACPTGEVFVPRPAPEGFLLGEGPPGARDAATQVILTQPFCLDEVEVTVAEYRRCVLERGCGLPEMHDPWSNYHFGEARDDHPVNLVDFDQAQYFCQSLGKQLPTEAQWKWAAGHGDGRTYPWGDEDPRCDNGLADFTPGGAPKSTPAGDVGCHGGGTSPVKAHPRGKSSWPSGDLFDLGGNVWEWTRDCYLPYPSGSVVDPSPQLHPALRGQCYVRALVGGGWNRSQEALKIRFRAGSRHTYRVPGLGFRCLREAG